MNINLRFGLWKLDTKGKYYHICENQLIWELTWLLLLLFKMIPWSVLISLKNKKLSHFSQVLQRTGISGSHKRERERENRTTLVFTMIPGWVLIHPRPWLVWILLECWNTSNILAVIKLFLINAKVSQNQLLTKLKVLELNLMYIYHSDSN
jgi:hypothetical protein